MHKAVSVKALETVSRKMLVPHRMAKYYHIKVIKLKLNLWGARYPPLPSLSLSIIHRGIISVSMKSDVCGENGRKRDENINILRALRLLWLFCVVSVVGEMSRKR